jgi:hypothetical protein
VEFKQNKLCNFKFVANENEGWRRGSSARSLLEKSS